MNSTFPGHVPADLVITGKLDERLARTPDLQAEAEAVRELSSLLIADPESAVHRFLELALELCRAGSAGLSILTETEAGEPIFHWQSLTGELAAWTGRTAPRHGSSCGLCLDHGETILTHRPGRYFPLLEDGAPDVAEALLVPLYDAGNVPLGVLWIVSHDERHGFDGEDARIMKHLAMQLVLALKILQSNARHRQTVEAMAQTLATKDAVVKEVNHRVKNTIQTAVALLRLQRRAARSAEAKIVLDEAEKRLSVFSSIHQMLYQRASDSQRISMDPLLRGLADALEQSFSDAAGYVRVEVETGGVALDPDLAIPLALIANEAITNAYKHGFPHQRAGTIRVHLRRSGKGELRLTIADDGIGMVTKARSGSLGLQLIRTFARQLDGQLAIDSKSGTKVSLSVREDHADAPDAATGLERAPESMVPGAGATEEGSPAP